MSIQIFRNVNIYSKHNTSSTIPLLRLPIVHLLNKHINKGDIFLIVSTDRDTFHTILEIIEGRRLLNGTP